MANGPLHERRRGWNWVGFWCALVFVGVASFLAIRPQFDGLLPHLVKVVVVTAVCSVLAGAYGDRFWTWLLTSGARCQCHRRYSRLPLGNCCCID